MNDDWEIQVYKSITKLNLIIVVLYQNKKQKLNIEEKLENQQQTIEKGIKSSIMKY